MEANKRLNNLLTKREELLIEIASLGMLIEEIPFYSIQVLEREVKDLTRLLKGLQQEKSFKASKEEDL